MNKTTSSDSKGKVANHTSAHKVLLYLNVITDLRLMSNLAAVLKLYSTRLDARTVCICSSEGSELLTESRANSGPEDVEIITSLVSSFSSSIEQATRLGLGQSKYSMTWAANSIILQTRIGSVVVSIILDESANLGLVEENMAELSNILRPLTLKV